MGRDRGFRPIRGAEEEDGLLEALAARKGIARLEAPAPQDAAGAEQVEPATAGHGTDEGSLTGAGPAPAAPPPAPAPASRARMRAMNLELPDYVMRQLKERALAEDCSVRHLVMLGLEGVGIRIDRADLVPDGRRRRGGRSD